MKRLLIWAIILFLVFLWSSTVYKSCQQVGNDAKNATSSAIDNTMDKAGNVLDKGKEAVSNVIKDEDEDEVDILADLVDEEDDRSSTTKEDDGPSDDKSINLSDSDIENEDMTDEDDKDEEDEATAERRTRVKSDGSSASEDSDNASSASSSSSINNNKYMVVAGSFRSVENAKIEMRRLRKKGYSDAEVVKFDRSDLHSICVARYNDKADARYLTKKLKKEDNIEAYVHRRRGKKAR